ncbi:putative ATP-dependent helicase HRQ1 isoform X4, partial [Tanacetum coccineum]
DRRKIESEFFGGKNCGVAATNALELGIDAGHIDVTLHLGFPGSIASYSPRDKYYDRSRSRTISSRPYSQSSPTPASRDKANINNIWRIQMGIIRPTTKVRVFLQVTFALSNDNANTDCCFIGANNLPHEETNKGLPWKGIRRLKEASQVLPD